MVNPFALGPCAMALSQPPQAGLSARLMPMHCHNSDAIAVTAAISQYPVKGCLACMICCTSCRLVRQREWARRVSGTGGGGAGCQQLDVDVVHGRVGGPAAVDNMEEGTG